MSVSKQDVLDALKKEGINSLEDLATAASRQPESKESFAFLVHKNYVVSS